MQNARSQWMHTIDAKLCSHLMLENSFRNIERQNNYRKPLSQYTWHCDRDPTWGRGSWSPCRPSTCMSTVCDFNCFCSSSLCQVRCADRNICQRFTVWHHEALFDFNIDVVILYKCQVCVCLIVNDFHYNKRAILDI